MPIPLSNFPNLKQYLRIEHDYDDNLLEEFIGVAIEMIKNATGYEIISPTTDDLENLIVYMLVNHIYENKDYLTEVKLNKVPFTLQTLLSQLQRRQEGIENNAET